MDTFKGKVFVSGAFMDAVRKAAHELKGAGPYDRVWFTEPGGGSLRFCVRDPSFGGLFGRRLKRTKIGVFRSNGSGEYTPLYEGELAEARAGGWAIHRL